MFKLKYDQLTTKHHVIITPEDALELLTHHNNHNRPIKRQYVNRFISDLINGDFKEIGSITISKNGNLLDGQHRLKAIAESGINATMTITFGQDDDNFDLLNEGHAMTITEFAKTNSSDMSGISTKVFSSASAILHLKKENKPRGIPVSKRELKRFINDNIDRFRQLSKRCQKVSYIYNPGTMQALEFLLYEMETEGNKDKVTKFFDNLWHMNLGGENEYTPEKAYAKWIGCKNSVHTGAAGEDNVVNGICRAWNAYKEGKELKQLRIPENYKHPDFRSK